LVEIEVSGEIVSVVDNQQSVIAIVDQVPPMDLVVQAPTGVVEVIASPSPSVEVIADIPQVEISSVAPIYLEVKLEGTQGPQGPQGPQGEAGVEVPYKKLTDFVSETVFYQGFAAAGTATSASVWRIKRVTLFPDGDVEELWANGSDGFSFIWDNRLSYSYS
jgi:hypothetical protein